MITGIGHVAFRVTDLDRALDFYCAKLGFLEAFRLEREGEPSPWIVYLQIAPGCFIELFPGAHERDSQPDMSAGYNHFCLAVDDMAATLRRLAANGLPITGEPQLGLDRNWQYWITDPDGNRIELMQVMPDSPQAAADTSPIIDLGDLAARSGAAKPAWKSQTDDLNLNLVVLEAGDGVAEHTNTEVDVLLIGIEGEGHVAIEGETHLLRTGQMTVVPKGAPRSIQCKAGRFAYFTCHRRRAGLWPEGIPRGNDGLR